MKVLICYLCDCYICRIFVAKIKRFVIICLALMNILEVQGRTAPLVVPASETSKLAGENLLCSCGNIVYYKGKLFTTANVGLIEVDAGVFSNLYTWGVKGMGIGGGPWVDTANGLLWVRLGNGKLLNFDGKMWRVSDFPKPMDDYFTRDDVWRGFRGVSNRKTFWIEGARCAWKWGGPKSGKWIQEMFPRDSASSSNSSYLVKRIIPCDEEIYFILRHESETPLVLRGVVQKYDWPETGDSIFYLKNDKLIEITNYVGFIGPATFSASSFKDMTSFITKLKQPSNKASIFILSKLANETSTILENYHGERLNLKRLQKYLVQDLNAVINGDSLYKTHQFDDVAIRQETKRLLDQNPRGEDLVRLNRLLLEDAYPMEISRNHFIATETAAGKDKGYIRTTSGDLLEVTRDEVRKIDTPGMCGAITMTPDGTLLASFGRLGVFELRGEWRELLKCPYPERSGEFKVHMAARESEIAIAVVPSPMPTGDNSGSNPLNAVPRLWVSRNREWLEVLLPYYFHK